MAGGGLVLDQQLPIAIVHVAQHAAGDLEFADRRAVDHVVEARQAVAEELLEAQADIVELGEDEAAVIMHVADGAHAFRRVALLETGVLVALAQRDRDQRTVGAEAPSVIRTTEELAGVAAGLGRDARALVRAAIEEDLHRVVGVAHHQDGLKADRRAEIVARVRHLAVVADINPGVGEEMLHLELEHFLVDIDVAMHFGGPDEVLDGGSVASVSRHGRAPAHSLRARYFRSKIIRGATGEIYKPFGCDINSSMISGGGIMHSSERLAPRPVSVRSFTASSAIFTAIGMPWMTGAPSTACSCSAENGRIGMPPPGMSTSQPSATRGFARAANRSRTSSASACDS